MSYRSLRVAERRIPSRDRASSQPNRGARAFFWPLLNRRLFCFSSFSLLSPSFHHHYHHHHPPPSIFHSINCPSRGHWKLGITSQLHVFTCNTCSLHAIAILCLNKPVCDKLEQIRQPKQTKPSPINHYLIPFPLNPPPPQEKSLILSTFRAVHHSSSKGIQGKTPRPQSPWTLTPESRSPSVSSRRRTGATLLSIRQNQALASSFKETFLHQLRASVGKVTKRPPTPPSKPNSPAERTSAPASTKRKRSRSTKTTVLAAPPADVRSLPWSRKTIVIGENAFQR